MLLKLQNNQWQLRWQTTEQTLFTDKDTVLTVAQWFQQVQAACHVIAQQPGKTVLLYQPDCQLFSVWFFALCLQGKHIVLAPDAQPGTLQYAMMHCDWQVPDMSPTMPEPATDNVESLLLAGDIRVSFFTSGSTGAPKLIHKTLTLLLTEVQTLQQQFSTQLPPNCQFAATVSHQHIYGLLFRLLWPMCNDQLIFRSQIRFLEQWQDLLQQHPTVLIASPAHLSRFDDVARLSPYRNNSCAVFSSGGPLPEIVPPLFINALGAAPLEVFGSTETGGIAFRQRHLPDTPWQVFDGISIGQNDELALTLTSPYLGHSEHYTTQDKVLLLDNRHFQLLGRLDRIVKLEEKRLALPEMEQHCLSCELVIAAAAIVLQQERPQLAMAVVLSPAGEQLLAHSGKLAVNQQLKQHLLQRFERVMLPRKFRYVACLPYNPQGKLPQQQLEALFIHD